MNLPQALQDPGTLAAALMIGARLGGLFLVAPFFSEKSLLPRARIGLLLGLCFLLSSAWLQQTDPKAVEALEHLRTADLATLGALGLGELLVGLTMGLCSRVVVAGVSAAGALIAFHAGLTMVNSLDMNAETQPVLDVYTTTLLMMLILGLDLHHAMLRVLADSLVHLPPGNWVRPGLEALRLGRDVLVTGVQLASPILVLLLLVELGMGVVQKAGPELQLLVVLMPARLGFGLLMLGLSLAYWKGLLTGFATESVLAMQQAVAEMARF